MCVDNILYSLLFKFSYSQRYNVVNSIVTSAMYCVLWLAVLVCSAVWLLWSSSVWALVNRPLQRGQLQMAVFTLCSFL